MFSGFSRGDRSGIVGLGTDGVGRIRVPRVPEWGKRVWSMSFILLVLRHWLCLKKLGFLRKRRGGFVVEELVSWVTCYSAQAHVGTFRVLSPPCMRSGVIQSLSEGGCLSLPSGARPSGLCPGWHCPWFRWLRGVVGSCWRVHLCVWGERTGATLIGLA